MASATDPTTYHSSLPGEDGAPSSPTRSAHTIHSPPRTQARLDNTEAASLHDTTLRDDESPARSKLDASSAASVVADSHESKEAKRRSVIELLRPGTINGLIALFVAFSCVFFSLAILVTSNGKATKTWTFQPSVYVAIASAVANVAISVAYSRAIPIAWYYRASRVQGATIRSLQRQWEAGSSLPLALLNIRDAGYPTAVAVLAALMIIDGPLLQQATSVRKGTTVSTITLNVSLSPEVPNGFSGYFEQAISVFTQGAVQVGEDWQKERPFLLSTSADAICKGTCRGKILGPGLASSSCNHTSWPITETMYFDPNATWGPALDDSAPFEDRK